MTLDQLPFYEAPCSEILSVAVESAFVSTISTQTESFDHESVDPEFE